MDGPYRTAWEPPPEPADEPAARGWDELAIPLVVLAVGCIRAVPALIDGEVFQIGATIALIMVVLGLIGVVFDLAQRLHR